MSTERLQKIIAHAGIASRRKAEELIEQRLVTVNGQVATLGDKADPARDDIRVAGKRVKAAERLRYVILNKNRGVVSTVDDPEGRPTVTEIVARRYPERLYPVGRLDIDSDGLILLTNDGDLANKLMHPSYGGEKTYKVLVEGSPSEGKLERWRRGLRLEDGDRTAPCIVKVLDREKRGTWLRVVMHEGKNRQIRRIAEQLGHPVKRLTRTHIESVALGPLRPGEFRELTDDEVAVLKRIDKKKQS